MNFKLMLAAASLAVAVAGPALARQDPPPPPSGIVIHLFGQNSIMSNVLPTPPDQPGPAAAAPTPGHTDPPATYEEPSTSQILHEMFVTGDPNNPPKPSTGRSGKGLAN